jgi:hypothetical protein
LKEDFKIEVTKIAVKNHNRKTKKAEKVKGVAETIAVLTMDEDEPSTPNKNDLGGRLYNMYSPPKETDEQKQRREQKSAEAKEKRDPLSSVRQAVKIDCETYFEDLELDVHTSGMTIRKNFDLLHYWQTKKNLSKYFWVRECAMKWLAVPAMSTPSERVWSICGVIDNPRRGRMDVMKIEATAMIHNNYHCVAHDHENIQQKAMKLMEQKRVAKTAKR